MICILLSACSKDERFHAETLYFYSSEMLSLVDQGKNDYSKKQGVRYTLMLVKFRPEEAAFEKFRKTYEGVSTGEGDVVLTDRTNIYIKKESNKKESISATELSKYVKPAGSGDYPSVEVWVTPYEKADYEVEAVEVDLLQP